MYERAYLFVLTDGALQRFNGLYNFGTSNDAPQALAQSSNQSLLSKPMRQISKLKCQVPRCSSWTSFQRTRDLAAAVECKPAPRISQLYGPLSSQPAQINSKVRMPTRQTLESTMYVKNHAKCPGQIHHVSKVPNAVVEVNESAVKVPCNTSHHPVSLNLARNMKAFSVFGPKCKSLSPPNMIHSPKIAHTHSRHRQISNPRRASFNNLCSISKPIRLSVSGKSAPIHVEEDITTLETSPLIQGHKDFSWSLREAENLARKGETPMQQSMSLPPGHWSRGLDKSTSDLRGRRSEKRLDKSGLYSVETSRLAKLASGMFVSYDR
ncbi:hypothetical protein AAMO2058_001031300 [Amorphochlora amoebiformis]